MNLRLTFIGLALVVAASSCNRTGTSDSENSTDSATASGQIPEQEGNEPVKNSGYDPNQPIIEVNWDELQKDLKEEKYPEVKGTNVSIRGNNERSIYSLGENVLFETDKAEIRKDADNDLQQIASSLAQRYESGRIYVYGYTDSVGSKSDNKDLSAQRAEAVKQWLVSKGNIKEDRITIKSRGENKPVESNATAAGREQNRRVEIVAVK